jgi:hypothetical protein
VLWTIVALKSFRMMMFLFVYVYPLSTRLWTALYSLPTSYAQMRNVAEANFRLSYAALYEIESIVQINQNFGME